MSTDTSAAIPIVDYLVLDEGEPHLVCNKCRKCSAAYFGRRNACASCGAEEFDVTPLPTSGRLETFTIVHLARPGIKVPFVAAMVDCGGVLVKANLRNVDPTVPNVETGIPVRLVTYELDTDAEGRPSMGFGFAPRSDAGA